MKRLITRFIFMVLAPVILASFFALPPKAQAAEDLLCSTYPVYLLARSLTQNRDYFQPRLLIDSQLGCPHDYVLTPADLERLSQANVLVINGLGLESFLDQAFKVTKPGLIIIDASKNLSSLINSDDADDAGHGDANHNHSPSNPHIFASPSMAMGMVDNIAAQLASLDPEGAAVYNHNAKALKASLAALLTKFKEAGADIKQPKIIAGHSIFDYLGRDLGLDIIDSIEELDGVEPSPARLMDLTIKAKKAGVTAILIDPQGNIRLAQALGTETGLPVAVIDPVSSGPADPPLDYYQKVMGTNLNVLTELLKKANHQPDLKAPDQ